MAGRRATNRPGRRHPPANRPTAGVGREVRGRRLGSRLHYRRRVRPQEQALESVYYESYRQHFASHFQDLEQLVALAKSLRNPHAEATTGVDLQVPAIMTYLERHGLALHGSEMVDIGSWEGQASHPISIRLSPLHIKVVGDPKMTLESFWQTKKCLAVGMRIRQCWYNQ